MKIKPLKTIGITILFIMFINIFLISTNTPVKARSIDVTADPNSWDVSDVSKENSGKLLDKAGGILGILTVVGVVISVVTLAIIGVKFLLGSVEEKANYKQTLLPWVIGALILMGASTIPNIVYNIVTPNENPTEAPWEDKDYTPY